MRSIVKELRRRNVFKVGAAYIVLAWVIVQFTDTVAPAIGLPEWTLRLVIWMLAIGLPVALVLAWAFELTPEGVKRSEDVPAGESITASTSLRLNTVIVTLIAVAVAFLLVDRFWPAGEPVTAVDSLSDDTAATEVLDSIAVLPFTNLSDDPGNEYFGDGLAEELLNLLAKVDGLKVAARTSTFYFKDKNPTITEVAEALDVDTIVEGSVRRSDNTIRVVVQLISAETNAHLWSERYDRSLDDLFQVQDDIANQIVAALMPHLTGSELPVISSDVRRIDPEHFERFLLARQKFYDGTESSLLEARDGFLGVTKVAPEFAPAWAWLARSWLELATRLAVDEDIAHSTAREAIDTALTLDPREAMAYVAKGLLFEDNEDDAAALDNYNKALEFDPNLVDAYVEREGPMVRLGDPDAAIESLQRARDLDPLHPEVLSDLAHLLNLQGNRESAFAILDELAIVNPTAAASMEGHLYTDNGDFARALYFAEQSDSAPAESRVFLAMVLGLHETACESRNYYQPACLAVLGRRDEAFAALDEQQAGTDNAHARADLTHLTYLALGEFDTARDLLWQRWSDQHADEPAVDMDFWDFVALAALMRKFGQTELIEPVLEEIRSVATIASPMHFGAYHIVKGYNALLSDDTEAAVAHFSVLADQGTPGTGLFETAVSYPWLFETDPRLVRIVEQFAANRLEQRTELEQLRSAQWTVARLREDYLAGEDL